MDTKDIKSGIFFGFGLLFAVFFIWFGIRLFGISGDTFSSGELFLFGVASILSGVFTVSTPDKTKWGISFGLFILGFYFFARAASVIDIAILSTLAGLLSWVAAIVMVALTYPNRR